MYSIVCASLLLQMFATNGLDATENYSRGSKDFYLKREHSLQKPYHASGITIPHWDFSGSTLITNNYVRLTPDSPGKNGSLWNDVPCFVRDWELRIHFKIHGSGDTLYGDGMAIWYTDDPQATGPVFGGKDYFKGLGVFLDTYENHKHQYSHSHPYISAMVNNGTLHYDHDEDGTRTRVAGCSAEIRGEESQISIRYEQRRRLTVSTFIMKDDNKGQVGGSWVSCFSVDGVRLPTGYRFGVSAKTGDLSDNHDLLSIKMFELDSPDYAESHREEDLAHVTPSAVISTPMPKTYLESLGDDAESNHISGFKIFLFFILGAFVTCLFIVGCIVAFGNDRTRNDDDKRYR